MANKYLDFISDEHLLKCVKQLHYSYANAKLNISKRKFYSNKIDVFKLTFDAKFNSLDERAIVEFEILRQIDKSINNSIGTFHEEILGGVKGYERGKSSGFDIKAFDNSLFADIKNKHNTMNSSSAESLFQKLARYADAHKNSKCYWVQILAKGSFNDQWFSIINGKEYSHSRVFTISGDQFYELLTGSATALFDMYRILPIAIQDYLNSRETDEERSLHSALKEIEESSMTSRRSVLDQITFENYSYYSGFDAL